MASKKSLLGGMNVKVQGMSGFDKSHYNAFTAPLGAIVPMVKQLVLPGKAKLSIKISAQLPPLASDAFLRTHLKVEAFLVPLRLCYGGFQSWFCGEKIHATASTPGSDPLTTAELPRLRFYGKFTSEGSSVPPSQTVVNSLFGPHSLMDYFNVKYQMIGGDVVQPSWMDPQIVGDRNYADFNIFPFLAYQLCCHHWYRNKVIERPLFSPPDLSLTLGSETAFMLPYVAFGNINTYYQYLNDRSYNNHALLNGDLLTLRYRNYGYDYFTTALPSAQDGSPMSVDTSSGSFTISSLREANALQHFAEVNQLSGPDYVQTLRARYNRAPSSLVAQKPVLIGSADFPMFTSGVEQSAPFSTGSQQTANPFEGIAARYGRAHAEGSDFVCETDVDEPCYLMVMCSLVPEANYAMGVAHDMKIFTEAGSIVDLPCSELERVGMEPVWTREVSYDDSANPSGPGVFGYQPRYMWHKAGQLNEVHGLFRLGASLESFIPQRISIGGSLPSTINSAFLKVDPSDLDNVTAVAGLISQYGVMIDSAIQLFVSEPLGESVMPSLVDPGLEHGESVYLSRGGISVNDR